MFKARGNGDWKEAVLQCWHLTAEGTNLMPASTSNFNPFEETIAVAIGLKRIE
jgi:hypothetical protein